MRTGMLHMPSLSKMKWRAYCSKDQDAGTVHETSVYRKGNTFLKLSLHSNMQYSLNEVRQCYL